MAEITADEIMDMAEGPKRITGEEGTVEERAMDDVIKGDRYGLAKGITQPPYGIRMAHIRFGKTS